MSNIIVTGAGSGCGFGFVEAFSKNPLNTIFAIDRTFPSRSKPSDKIITIVADLTSEDAVSAMSKQLRLQNIVFDIVIYCAGVRGLVPGLAISDQASIEAAESLHCMNVTVMQHAFQSNAGASFLFLRAILEFCRRCNDCSESYNTIQVRQKNNCSCLLASRTKILVLGSRRGSMVGSSADGGCYAYRASKAAQHAIVVSMAADTRDISWLLCHPGRVDTRLVSVREPGSITVEESVHDMILLLKKTWKSPVELVDRHGTQIPW